MERERESQRRGIAKPWQARGVTAREAAPRATMPNKATAMRGTTAAKTLGEIAWLSGWPPAEPWGTSTGTGTGTGAPTTRTGGPTTGSGSCGADAARGAGGTGGGGEATRSTVPLRTVMA